jgi:RHS repeat-associated protein
VAAFVFDMRFPGQRFDATSGMSYNYFRDYDPSTGRYVESDPIGLLGGITTYGYASQRPLNLVDPKGLLAFGPTCNAQMRAIIIQAVVELSNEITSKAKSATKNCEKGDCDFSLAGDVMRNVSSMIFSCNNTFLCAQTLVNGVAYYHPSILTEPRAAEILKPGQCGCLKGTIFHEATHQARWDMSENEVRKKTLGCVSCAQNVNEHGDPL